MLVRGLVTISQGKLITAHLSSVDQELIISTTYQYYHMVVDLLGEPDRVQNFLGEQQKRPTADTTVWMAYNNQQFDALMEEPVAHGRAQVGLQLQKDGMMIEIVGAILCWEGGDVFRVRWLPALTTFQIVHQDLTDLFATG